MTDENSSSYENPEQFEKRKAEHIAFALSPNAQAYAPRTFDDVLLSHNALPEIDFNEIQLVDRNPKALFSSPFFVASMTAGHKDGDVINDRLAEACQEKKWAMGVGSQRRELFDVEEKKRWQNLKKKYPGVKFLSNIGISQAIQSDVKDLEGLIESLDSVALIIHANPLQEVIQKEGTPNFKGAHKAIENICTKLSRPVILKETGCGFSHLSLKSLNSLGLFAVDVSGLGGTHWGRVEGLRADEGSPQKLASQTFANWGVSTVDSLLYASQLKLDYRIWASGGLRNGLDVAKSLALGAKKVSFAKSILQKAMLSSEDVIRFMNQVEYELQIAMFCTGSKNLSKLQQKSNIINYPILTRDLNV